MTHHGAPDRRKNRARAPPTLLGNPHSADHASCPHGKPPSRRAGGRATVHDSGGGDRFFAGVLPRPGLRAVTKRRRIDPGRLATVAKHVPPSRTRPPDERGRSAAGWASRASRRTPRLRPPAGRPA